MTKKKKELIDICKLFAIKKYSNKKKKDLVEFILQTHNVQDIYNFVTSKSQIMTDDNFSIKKKNNIWVEESCDFKQNIENEIPDKNKENLTKNQLYFIENLNKEKQKTCKIKNDLKIEKNSLKSALENAQKTNILIENNNNHNKDNIDEENEEENELDSNFYNYFDENVNDFEDSSSMSSTQESFESINLFHDENIDFDNLNN